MNKTDIGKVLLVDDQPANLKVLSESLRHEDWVTLVAPDGESALEQVAYSKPDLILLDVLMPGIDGFETCNRLKSNPETAAIPVIFMTALSDIFDKVKGFEIGAVDYITKPFQQEEVIARVKLHLRLHHLSQKLSHKVEEQALTEAKLQKLNQELEARVEARTAELSESLKQLQQMQTQLIQSEKMSAIGQLTAGIAHEINNPVGFIHGNLDYVEEYTDDLIKLVKLYRDNSPEPIPTIKKQVDAIDLDFVSGDLAKILASMRMGTDRIVNIVSSLKQFSRIEKDKKPGFDIHGGIDDTLTILSSKLKETKDRPTIQVTKTYGELPPITCNYSQLNQVFMNILANAIDALEERDQGRAWEVIEASPSCINITTCFSDQDGVTLKISDNGLGMSDAVQRNIFDPFFTTKDIGKGTGMGLAISHQIIVQNHQGSLECHSVPGQGTTFVIQLPVQLVS
ncbi:MAG: response regulator [Cyanobacteria bacterium]|nr:response regulator [Cyanobacteriota bacterium]